MQNALKTDTALPFHRVLQHAAERQIRVRECSRNNYKTTSGLHFLTEPNGKLQNTFPRTLMAASGSDQPYQFYKIIGELRATLQSK